MGKAEEMVGAVGSVADHIVIDRSEQIEADAQAIQTLSERVPVLAFVNNHFAGYAPQTLRQLQERLGGRPLNQEHPF